VLLHAYRSSPKALAGVERAVRRACPSLEIEPFAPTLPLSILSMADPVKIAFRLARRIDRKWSDAIEKGEPFDEIILVGHSTGSLLARKLYIIACGETDLSPFEAKAHCKPLAWAPFVSRLILLAGMNRGWRVSHHLSLTQAPIWWAGSKFARIAEWVTGRRSLILQVRVGAEFITQLRIQWLRMRQAADWDESRAGRAATIQLLGSIDDMVSPRDNVDLVAGRDFIYLDVPYSGHKSIVELDDPTVPPGGTLSVGAIREAAIGRAVALSVKELKKSAVIPDDSDNLVGKHDRVDQVVFVIHGIRDAGYWTHKIARAIRGAAPNDSKLIATETSSYGYFPMLPFLFSLQRRKKVEWLMDQYAEAIALYPNAKAFHFVGHSNGTYCLIEALRHYPCCQFSRVVLAGCVGRSDLDWERFLRSTQGKADARRYGRVDQVLNFVATDDIIVAAFPRLFETWLPIQRLGGAGHIGFTKVPKDGVTNLRYVRGGHAAGLAEPLWPDIASFVLTGQVRPLPAQMKGEQRTARAWVFGWLPFLLWGLAIFAVWQLGRAVLAASSWLGDLAGAGWLAPVAMTLFVLGVIRLLKWI
jgi:hypothetical protein